MFTECDAAVSAFELFQCYQDGGRNVLFRDLMGIEAVLVMQFLRDAPQQATVNQIDVHIWCYRGISLMLPDVGA